ncbi:MAG: TIGR04551 family protein [Polyangiaceae bacterium]|nr:TIGR04551 family protein [Polyangiaceae bacterium]
MRRPGLALVPLLVLAGGPALAQPVPAKPAEPPAAGAPAEKPAEPPAAPPAGEARDDDADAAGDSEGEAPAPEPPPRQPGRPGFTPMPLRPASGAAAPASAPKAKPDADEVYAEDWWSHARPVLELHGYFRVRAEVFHEFALGRIDAPNQALWPVPSDHLYNGMNDQYGAGATDASVRCTADEVGDGDDDTPPGAGSPPAQGFPCRNRTQSGANMRLRLNPEIHVSDNLRILAQVDLLDNLLLGSTPEGYSNEPGAGGGYSVVKRGGYAPLGAFDSNQSPPSAGINGYRDSIRVKRAWGEYLTPVGQLRFGRMPSHWGLGILANSGDGPDDDYQSTSDRIMLLTGVKSIDLYFVGAWDFPNEGATSDTLALPQAQPYDLAQLDDVDQYVFAVVRRLNPDLAKLALARGEVVLNGGFYVVHRKQLLANDTGGGAAGQCSSGAAALGCTSDEVSAGYVRRGASAWIPDAWFQLRYEKFRFEFEAVTIQGTIENTQPSGFDYRRPPGGKGWKIQQYGIATELEQRLVEDRLRLGFNFGWASGDPDVAEVVPGSGGLTPGTTGLQPQAGFADDTISTFRFHPNYRVDLILHRNMLTRVQGTHYFRPSVEYDFLREPNGQRFGGGFAGIWTRATEAIQAPGHQHDLGIELDFSLYYQAKDGALNDDPEKLGGFFTLLQYGVLFPLAGLGYPSLVAERIDQQFGAGSSETSSAQILRWYLGIAF